MSAPLPGTPLLHVLHLFVMDRLTEKENNDMIMWLSASHVFLCLFGENNCLKP